MWTKKEIIEDLEGRLKKERLQHTFRVVEMAEKLALHYKIDVERTKMAALLHDCGKLKSKELTKEALLEYPIELSDFMKENKQLIHAVLGEKIAKERYEVKDEGILSAIRYHTVGNRDMNFLDKLIYIADIVEEGRQFEGVEELRKIAFHDIEEACIFCMDNTLRFLIGQGWMIDPQVIEARNQCIRNLKEAQHGE